MSLEAGMRAVKTRTSGRTLEESGGQERSLFRETGCLGRGLAGQRA